MNYDDRPWLSSYDPDVRPEIPIPDQSYPDLLQETFQRFPEQTAYHFLGLTTTFREFQNRALKFAHLLREQGCQPGDVVAVNLPNIPQYLICLIQYTGGTTGLPKGTMLTHRNLMANIAQGKTWFHMETGILEAPIGGEGELIIQGPQVMKGYLNRPEETAHALREFQGEVWMHTGDVARMNEAGYFTLVDRAKDMLNVGGFKVFSREVEEKLYDHPAVDFCAIIGVPNPQRPGSELVKLVIQRSQASKDRQEETLKQEILDFVRENLSPYKVPKIIEFVDSLPLTPVGKVDKKALRPRQK